ncbi:unnamed protein product [Rotaria sp. Silwood1]|nr:unnamed protein product [Rotaria sp. Silwood1]CAF1546558.1 unnamed protein product [Rotaria sp. Silwood1]
MSINHHNELIRGILIGSTVSLSSTILILTVYLLYRYRKELFNKGNYFNTKKINIERNQQSIKNDLNNHTINKQEREGEEQEFDNENKSFQIGTRPTFIEELMRKSLQLAITAEIIKDNQQQKTNSI